MIGEWWHFRCTKKPELSHQCSACLFHLPCHLTWKNLSVINYKIYAANQLTELGMAYLWYPIHIGIFWQVSLAPTYERMVNRPLLFLLSWQFIFVTYILFKKTKKSSIEYKIWKMHISNLTVKLVSLEKN
jgi:hypothetical protein